MSFWILSGLGWGVRPGLRGRGLIIALCCCCSLECLAQSASDGRWSAAPSSSARSWGEPSVAERWSASPSVYGAPSPGDVYSPQDANAWRFAPRVDTPRSSDGYGLRSDGSLDSRWRGGSAAVGSGFSDSVPAQGYRFRDDPSLNGAVRAGEDASRYRFRPLSDAERRQATDEKDSVWRPFDSGEEGRRPADLYDSMQPPGGNGYDQPEGWR